MPRRHLTRREAAGWWLVFLILLFVAGIHVYWMRVYTHLPLWGMILILLPGIAIWGYALWGLRYGADDTEVIHRKGEVVVGLILAVSTLYLAIYAAARLFLIYLYGLARVQSEHLHFISMPKGHPWVVSNGDQIFEGQYLHFVMSGALWFVIFIPIYVIVHRLLPRARKAGLRPETNP